MSTVVPPRAGDDRLVSRIFVPYATGYWRGVTAVQAWALVIALGVAVFLSIGANFGFSMWNRWFFDALEQKDYGKLGWSLLALVGIGFGWVAVDVIVVLTRETTQVRWRAWFTAKVMNEWLGHQRFYHLNAAGKDESTVPEYRIADDIRWATEPILDFYIGLLGAAFSIASFFSILWFVGGSITVGSGDYAITIPGYMAVAGAVHSLGITALMMYCGRALPRNMAARNEAEANFRLSLMRVRENSDSIASTHGEAGERAILWRGLDSWVKRWMIVVRQDGQLTWIQKSNGVIMAAAPLLLACPKYMTGEISLGAMMQLASAYIPFQTSIAWAFDNYRALSVWHASARRVAGLIRSMRDLDADLDHPDRSAIDFGRSDDGRIHVSALTVTDRQGRPLVAEADLTAEPGERLLLTGESGTGKSALVRAIAGLWPWGKGSVRLPRDARVSFIPQRAYLPLGSLRDVLRYPLDRLDADDGAIVSALVRCGIGELAPRLDTVERWDQRLSNGERQRLAFCGLILQRPAIVVLDDALAALDRENQAALMTMLREILPKTTILSVAQHGGTDRYYDRVMILIKSEGGARLQNKPPTDRVAVLHRAGD